MSAAHDHDCAAHSALVYDHPGAFVDGVSAFVRDGLHDGRHVVAAIASAKADWVREELGADARAIEFVDADALYSRHGPMLRGVVGYLERLGTPGRGGMCLIAEQALARRQPVDVRAYMRYEAACNVVYDRYDVSVLCPYDAKRLPGETLTAALQTHPTIVEHGRSRTSDLFVDPRTFVRDSSRARPAPAETASWAIERPEDVADARSLMRMQGQLARLGRQAVEDLVLAVSEVATNALLHGRAPRRLRSYLDARHLVCEVRDAGPGLPDPLLGYLPPDDRSLGGRGLWIAHQLCDIVEVANDAGRTSVYLHMRLPATS